MTKQLFIKTFGCQMNEYDSEKIVDVLREDGEISLTESPDNADIIILNTCSIRERAEVKVYSDLGRYRALKEANPNIRIGVGGCVASQEGENIIKRAPYVDLVFGPQTLHRLPTLLKKRDALGVPQIDITFPEIEKFDRLPVSNFKGPSASVSIMEGCSKYCSFCVVPYTRGEEISRPLDDVLNEIIELTMLGVQEIILLGQNVNAYRGFSKHDGVCDFATLLEYVAEIGEVKRIRFTTSHPNEMTEELIACFGKIDKLSKQFHLPIQSGSDRVLSAMKRNYTVLEYKSIIKKLKKVCPDISLTSDFIIGFPNETVEEFNQTKKIMEEINFDYSFSFLYSPRPGTPASFIKDNISKLEKEQRLREFQDINITQGKEHTLKMIGTTQRILIDRISKRKQGVLLGKTDNNRVIEIIGSSNLLNQFVNVKIQAITEKNLEGIIV
ncbi:tRNA (N6-isopentenyl adenosine(37)-C2)-methylthiotransferase MiaB [Methylophilaceae bacterium]|jgi:tRNA-2-methylthio-N6-dimethylallyladenosine synthase|nr:MAG: (dimethylallyl)adenosine tRNA methylthiotransferase [Methylophilales bacterium BACL14 MAG-120910-bin43]MDA7700225.1 tRNA (N6-isopentenyl adenosine(37)-C2)-methylthiotransferase MiaB [Methylophilaceae bacterium]|tara:strand:- start:15454 stop:16776 length:1323 start_codon:yes stop_codon:yes gene_type:complete